MNSEKTMPPRKKVKKQWVIVGNTYNLFVEFNGKTYYKKFMVYEATPVELNKRLRENDVVDQIAKDTGKKVDLV